MTWDQPYRDEVEYGKKVARALRLENVNPTASWLRARHAGGTARAMGRTAGWPRNARRWN